MAQPTTRMAQRRVRMALLTVRMAPAVPPGAHAQAAAAGQSVAMLLAAMPLRAVVPLMAPPPMMANRPLLARGLLATHKATAATTATTKVDRPAAMHPVGMEPERCGRGRPTGHASPPARLRSTWRASHGRHGNPARPPPQGSGAAQGRWADKQLPLDTAAAAASEIAAAVLETAAASEIVAEPETLAHSPRRGARRICTA